MNLFVTSPDPETCARDLDDARVVNQLRETCQLLSTAVRYALRSTDDQTYFILDGDRLQDALYAKAHEHHPVTLWVRSSRQAFQWTVDHVVALSNEYHLRFTGTHKSAQLAWRFLAGREYLGELFYDCHDLTFADCARNQALGLDFTGHADGVHEGYRAYLAARWQSAPRPPRWKNGQPWWYTEG